MEGEASFDYGIATELRLGLPGTDSAAERSTRGTKRSMEGKLERCDDQEIAPVAKYVHITVLLVRIIVGNGCVNFFCRAQVIGWPPVRSYRKNSFRAKETAEANIGGMHVKVSMDGAPCLRKIDLKMCRGYKQLREGLEELFKCLSLGIKIDQVDK